MDWIHVEDELKTVTFQFNDSWTVAVKKIFLDLSCATLSLRLFITFIFLSNIIFLLSESTNLATVTCTLICKVSYEYNTAKVLFWNITLCTRTFHIEACKQSGFNYTDDFNGAHFEGVGTYHITTKNGFRASTAKSYLRPALKRRNVSLETHAHVTRILFDGARASGIEYKQNGNLHSSNMLWA